MNPIDQELVAHLRSMTKWVQENMKLDEVVDEYYTDQAAARLTSLSQANERMAGALAEFFMADDARRQLFENDWESDAAKRNFGLALNKLRSAISDLPGDSKPVVDKWLILKRGYY